MEKSQSLCSPTSMLLCNENAASLDGEDEEIREFGSVLEEGYDEEYVRVLLGKEIKNVGLQMRDFLQNSSLLRARLDGIQYSLSTRARLGFRLQTAYASVMYIDRFLSIRSLDELEKNSWAIRLLSMACLSLAAKVDEHNRVPSLSEFCLGDYNFGSNVIQRMELLVLHTLDWKMGSVTPFSFVNFFRDKFADENSPRNGVSRVVDVILASVKDVKIMCHRPSVIAAAATLFVMDQRLSKDALKLKLHHLVGSDSLENLQEDIISCYYLVQEMEIERSNLSEDIKSPDLSPIQLQRGETYGNPSSGNGKRKRLTFNQGDQTGDLPEDKKGKQQ